MVTEVSGTDVDGALDTLVTAAVRYDDLVARQRYIVHTLVWQLRSHGVTWRDIGKAAGISHVAAMKRWGTEPVPVPVDLAPDDDPEDY